MNYESIKSFILVVLVGISLLLSFILWSYQPNYDYIYDTSYVNEVNIGGKEKTKNELVEPIKIIFHHEDRIRSFSDPEKRRELYKDMASWVMDDYKLTKSKGRPQDDRFVEMAFPTDIPADFLTNLFTFNDEIETPDWLFDRVFMRLDDETKSVEVLILSKDNQRQITATIDKTETYHILLSYLLDENEFLEENVKVGNEDHPIYIPKEKITMPKKTVIATSIDPELFVNALFRNPSLVTPNTGEAYFTDGQRGMRIVQDGRALEFINPLQTNYEQLEPVELIERSVDNINEHKGWTNNYIFDSMNQPTNHIRYRLSYDGYPVYDHGQLSIIEQEWREHDLYQYNRSLVQIGNLLNSEEMTLTSGEEVARLVEEGNSKVDPDDIVDIRIGYFLNYLDDEHSLALEPSWFIVLENEWIRFDSEDFQQGYQSRGED